MAPRKHARRHVRRKVRLIERGLQLRLTLTFVGLSALSLLLQYILFMSVLTRTAVGLPNDGMHFMQQGNGVLLGRFLASFGVLLPLTFGIGVIVTHRFAGPVHRLQEHLEQTLRGARPADCRLREGDELQELCALVNQVTESLRRGESTEASEADGARAREAA